MCRNGAQSCAPGWRRFGIELGKHNSGMLAHAALSRLIPDTISASSASNLSKICLGASVVGSFGGLNPSASFLTSARYSAFSALDSSFIGCAPSNLRPRTNRSTSRRIAKILTLGAPWTSAKCGIVLPICASLILLRRNAGQWNQLLVFMASIRFPAEPRGPASWPNPYI